MVEIKLDDVLSAEVLGKATKANPIIGTITSIRFIELDDMPFEPRDGKGHWELTIQLPNDDDPWKWMPNKTSMKAIMARHGKESDDWTDKEVDLFVVTQNVGGEMKEVVYGK